MTYILITITKTPDIVRAWLKGAMKIRCAVALAGKMGVFKMRTTKDPINLTFRLSRTIEFTCISFDSFPEVIGLCGVDLMQDAQDVNHTIERCGNNSWGELPRGPVVIVGAPDPETGEFTDLPESFISEMPIEDQ
jgi:hypothetical protein